MPSIEFYCDDCDFIAASNTTLNKHYLSKKHRIATGELKKFKCPHCCKGITNNSNLTKHLKICKSKPTNDVVQQASTSDNTAKALEIAMNTNKITVELVDLMKQKLDEKDKKISELENKKAAVSNGGLSFCKEHFPDADVLTSIDFNKHFPKGNRFEETLILYFTQDKFHEYVGDAIIEAYLKTEDEIKKQSFWCSDVSRKTMLIHVLNSKQIANWKYDSKSVTFIDKVIKPIFTDLQKILNTYRSSIKPIGGDYGKAIEVRDNCVKLETSLGTTDMSNAVIQYIAPHFKLDITNTDV